MRTKRGISMAILIITVTVMTIIATVAVVQITNVMEEIEMDNFALEITSVQDKIKEYYLILGSLPVKTGEQYTAEELTSKYTDSTYAGLLINEITINSDTTNTFYVIDLDLLQVQTSERGSNYEELDMFVVASNTLNVYYLKGIEYDGLMRFSTATLVHKNEVEVEQGESITGVILEQGLNVSKDTNVWADEIKITINNKLDDEETLQYSIASQAAKTVSNNIIIINSSTMTTNEIIALESNKTVIINKIRSGEIVDTKEISISNLDIAEPSLGTMEMTNTSDTNYNVIKLNSSDAGGSGVKAIYYDYYTILKNDIVTLYYSDRSQVTNNDLLEFGKVSKDGVIKLPKSIKSIVATVIDNAGNVSESITYEIEDTYLASQ